MRLRVWWIVVAAALVAAGCGGDGSSSGNGDADTAGVDTGEETDTGEIVITYDTFVGEDTTTADTVTVDTYVPPQPGEFGYTCDGNDDCNSGWCIQTADGRKCTRTCVEECPAFHDCREAPGTDATYICVPTFTHLCDPCEETADCNEAGQTGNYCLSYGASGRFCGGACNNEADCPGGYVCRLVPVGGGGQERQCVPPDGTQCSCSPLAKSLQLSTVCFIENEHGKCEGSRFCTQSGLNSCDAVDPFPESCNGADDNCNGIVDDFPPDYQCFIENEFGSCPGAGTCTEGQETCVGEAPKPEQCNQIDDDCDGETDEDLCDDQNPCTDDFCNSDGDCQHTNNNKLCDDNNVCSQVDKCEDGQCKGYNPLPCGDGNVCFNYQCDPIAGCLSEFANGASCEDGDPCTVDDRCNQGVCVAGGWDPCDDANPCTNDSCKTGQGCKNEPVTNGTSCGGLDGQCTIGQCIQGTCQGTAYNNGGPCDPGSSVGPCQQGICQNKVCTLSPKPDGSGCQNNNAPDGDCKAGQCNGGTCVSYSGPSTSCEVEACPPCADFIECAFCEPTVPGHCTSSGSCTPDFSGVTCSASCPAGYFKICGFCIPYQ